MNPEQNAKKNIGMVIATLVVAGVVLVTVLSDKKEPATLPQALLPDTTVPTVTTRQPDAPVTTPAQPKPPVTASSVYKDGTYSATGSYMSPGGGDQLGVSVRLVNDVITDVAVTPGAGDRTSARYQEAFISGYKQYVVGKNIANVRLTKVSGASLTPIGFNDALSQIKAKARV